MKNATKKQSKTAKATAKQNKKAEVKKVAEKIEIAKVTKKSLQEQKSKFKQLTIKQYETDFGIKKNSLASHACVILSHFFAKQEQCTVKEILKLIQDKTGIDKTPVYSAGSTKLRGNFYAITMNPDKMTIVKDAEGKKLGKKDDFTKDEISEILKNKGKILSTYMQGQVGTSSSSLGIGSIRIDSGFYQRFNDIEYTAPDNAQLVASCQKLAS